jgi:hypothetical protein
MGEYFDTPRKWGYDELAIELANNGHAHFVSLRALVSWVWGQRRKEIFEQGLSEQDYRKYVASQFTKLRMLGYPKVVNWGTHQVAPLPEHLYGTST